MSYITWFVLVLLKPLSDRVPKLLVRAHFFRVDCNHVVIGNHAQETGTCSGQTLPRVEQVTDCSSPPVSRRRSTAPRTVEVFSNSTGLSGPTTHPTGRGSKPIGHRERRPRHRESRWLHRRRHLERDDRMVRLMVRGGPDRRRFGLPSADCSNEQPSQCTRYCVGAPYTGSARFVVASR